MGTKDTTIDLDTKMDVVTPIAENDFITSDGTPEWQRKALADVKTLLAQFEYDDDYGCYYG